MDQSYRWLFVHRSEKPQASVQLGADPQVFIVIQSMCKTFRKNGVFYLIYTYKKHHEKTKM